MSSEPITLASITPQDASEEKRTLREWLKDNNPPPGLVSDICTFRALVALGCTMRGWDPGSAGHTPMTRAQLHDLVSSAHALWKKTLADNKISQEHWAPILPADGMLFAMIIKKPESGAVVRYQDEMLNGAMAAATGQRDGLRSALQMQMLNECALFPELDARTRVFSTYGALGIEFATKCNRLAGEAVEEILGK